MMMMMMMAFQKARLAAEHDTQRINLVENFHFNDCTTPPSLETTQYLSRCFRFCCCLVPVVVVVAVVAFHCNVSKKYTGSRFDKQMSLILISLFITIIGC